MKNQNQAWKKIFQHSTYRLTPQRKAVLDTLAENRDRHLSAEEIYSLVQKKGEDVGLTTVYRTLHLLSDLKLVRKLELEEKRKVYELDLPGLTHSHFICLNCGKVIETAPIQLAEWSRYLPDEDIILTDYSLRLFGYCSDCQR